MSITAVREIVCRCGAPVRVSIATSVNPERHPHMREAILRRTFHVFECGACHQPIGVDKEFLYIDLTRREFYGVFPLAAAGPRAVTTAPLCTRTPRLPLAWNR